MAEHAKYFMKKTYIISKLNDEESKKLAFELRQKGFSVERRPYYGGWSLRVGHDQEVWATWLVLRGENIRAI